MLSQNILCPQTLIEVDIDANESQKMWQSAKAERLEHHAGELFCAVIRKEVEKHLRLN